MRIHPIDLRSSFKSLLFAASSSLLVYSTAIAQPLFTDQQPLTAVLSVPLTQTYEQKGEDARFYIDGNFSYKDANDVIVRLPLKVKTRGNFRRAHCNLPPLRLNFPVKLVKNTLFHGQDKLKLVGPCQPGGIFNDLVGLEHLAYQVFATVSDYALHTRVLNLSYVDLDGKQKPRTTTAFVIEDISEFAKRKQLKHVQPQTASRYHLDLHETALLEVFALFIANNDYSTLTGMPGELCCHNVELLAPPVEGGKLIPVPYDFDMSGLVNAPYAAPPGTVPIKSVRQRYFNGWCKDDEYYQAAIARFKQQKTEIMALVDSSELIRASMKKRTKKYFEEFYELVDDPARYQKEIVGRCRGSTVG